MRKFGKCPNRLFRSELLQKAARRGRLGIGQERLLPTRRGRRGRHQPGSGRRQRGGNSNNVTGKFADLPALLCAPGSSRLKRRGSDNLRQRPVCRCAACLRLRSQAEEELPMQHGPKCSKQKRFCHSHRPFPKWIQSACNARRRHVIQHVIAATVRGENCLIRNALPREGRSMLGINLCNTNCFVANSCGPVGSSLAVELKHARGCLVVGSDCWILSELICLGIKINVWWCLLCMF